MNALTFHIVCVLFPLEDKYEGHQHRFRTGVYMKMFNFQLMRAFFVCLGFFQEILFKDEFLFCSKTNLTIQKKRGVALIGTTNSRSAVSAAF